MQSVWWKCPLGHSWKAKISERAIEGKGCKVCEKDYLTVFPKLAVMYYWILYYTYLSPQQYRDTEEIIGQLQPHIQDISYRTYFRKRKEAIEALSSVLWGYTSRDSLNLLEHFFPDNGREKGPGR